MSAKTGHDLKIFYNSATHASPTWVEITQVEDVNIDQLAWNTAELVRRATRFLLELATVQRLGATFNLKHGLSATVYEDLRDAHLNKTVTEFWIANGAAATVGTEGLRMGCLIKEFPWDQPLSGVSSHNVRIVPTYFEEAGSEVFPDWYEITE